VSALLDQQQLFARLVGEFLTWIFVQGYAVTFSEAWRSPEEAQVQAAKGAGIACSLHTERLAIDLNLFKDGVLLETVDDYRPLGEKWCSMHELARWGGNFTRVDADHFSMEWLGRQ
jgi:hypothetical protein